MFLLIEEPNLLQNLKFAQQQQDWNAAAIILRALGQVYNQLGFITEFRMLRQRALTYVGINIIEAKRKGKSAFEFWIYLMGCDAFEAVQRRELEKAREIHLQILHELTALNDSSLDNEIAVANANLGMIALKKHDFTVAFDHYQKALKIYEDTDKSYKAANIYYELGILAQVKWDFKASIHYFKNALKIYEETNNLYRIAGIYQQLGLIARRETNYDIATNYLQESSQIFQELGDYYLAAGVYHELGQVAKEQGNLEVAYNYFYKSLQIYEDTQDLYNASDEYQSLGELAKIQRNYDEAIAYFQKAFNTRISVKAWRKVSETSMEWGKTLEVQQDYVGAVKPYIYTLVNDINNQHYPEWVAEGIECVARMLRVLGENQFDTIWREVTGGDCAGEVREAIWAARDRLDEEG